MTDRAMRLKPGESCTLVDSAMVSAEGLSHFVEVPAFRIEALRECIVVEEFNDPAGLLTVRVSITGPERLRARAEAFAKITKELSEE